MKILLPAMSPDGLDVQAKSLPARRRRAGLQPFQHARLQWIPFWFHVNPDRMDGPLQAPGECAEKERAQPLVLFTES
jgi:hypothetical protein